MRKTISLIACVWLILSFNIAQAAIQTAEEVVVSTVDAVLERLTNEREAINADPSKIYGLVNELVIPRFDFVSMSKWVLGKKSWRSASGAQREQFISEFRTLLVRTYVKALLEYSKQSIEYLPAEKSPSSNLVVVKTKVNQDRAKDVPIDYRMHVSGGKWKVVDVVVNGLSLVSTYRGSFASEIRKTGLDSLISKLSRKNATMINARTVSGSIPE